MTVTSLRSVADAQLVAARTAASGRSAHTVLSGRGRLLSQTVLALVAGRGLDEHESPGDVTLQVLEGQVELRSGADTWVGVAGDLLLVPPSRHSVWAVEDSAVLLTVAKASA